MIKKINSYFSLWHSLLFFSFSIIGYLLTTHMSEALSFSSAVTYFKKKSAEISWSPSQGSVSYYVLKITDTNYISQNSSSSVVTAVKEIQSRSPYYQLACENNHSYQVSVKAVSYSGFSSEFSAPSILFICDQEKPEIQLDPLPSLNNLTSPKVSITGSYRELNLDSILINGVSASIDPFTRTFATNSTLTKGINQFVLIAKDLAGNTSREEFVLTYSTGITDRLDSKVIQHPYAFDYNNDAKIDLLVGTEEGQVSVFMNKGSNEIPLLSEFRTLRAMDGNAIDVGSRAVPCMADMNGDGLMDLLLGSGEGYLFYCKNLGRTGEPLFESPVPLVDVMSMPIAVEINSSPCVVDWDGDTQNDILLGSGDGETLLYRNEGHNGDTFLFSGPEPLKINGLPIQVGMNSIPFVTDWDSDGGKDLLIEVDGGYLHLYLNSVVIGEPDLMGGEKVDREEHIHVLEKELAIPYFIGVRMLQLKL